MACANVKAEHLTNGRKGIQFQVNAGPQWNLGQQQHSLLHCNCNPLTQ